MTTIFLIIAGILIGTIVIALGGGGAAFYLGILSSSFNLAPATAAATSVVTAVPPLIIGVIAYIKQGRVNFRLGNQMLLASLPAVIIGSIIAPYIPEQLYKWLIAIILVYLGIRIFVQQFKKTKKKKQHGKFAAAVYGFISGLMVGVAGLSGGGPVLAGLLILGLDTFNATATSSYVLVGMCVLGSALHLTTGSIYWQAGIPLIIGAAIGALIAPYVVQHFLSKSKYAYLVQYFIAIVLVIMGIKTVF
ncbi:sulfite exporter TauE/SafE family protein [Companilactobacillus halodurans]|uniref:Probable membrane transporter protein n=1 Tax=Companilactobacillus halodurans TaxID=2584183 RepID=A0A5P0ZPU9_9LACO|nr:sulfite exporter TauE/SafE family protein [Companilactobacillus halodurans]MQS76277.1 sulfite exporter TauE/SafE family protein [Companilactobacillus halodurans]MQS96593.1 sulfite exporter TauE/SafE family protein [Companilactobacillus halodurans]